MINSNDKINRILPLLDVNQCSYDEWVKVGATLKGFGFSVNDFDQFSAKDTRQGKYKGIDDVQYHWNSFTPMTDEAFICGLAKSQGVMYYVQNEHGNTTTQLITPVGKPLADLRNYLYTVFRRGELVYITTDANQKKDDPNKYDPKYTAKAVERDELIARINKAKSFNEVFPSADDKKGVWVVINPMQPNGATKECCSAYRYALLESDDMPIDKQIQWFKDSNLPITALIDSGNKSAHALVMVDAKDYEQYRERVADLYRYCSEHGFKVDEANKNPNRFSRLPGAARLNNQGQQKTQKLIATKLGKANWKEWELYQELRNIHFPEIIKESKSEALPPLAPELVEGILRREHIMSVNGDSKSGKSFALIELAVAISEGTKWLGAYQCNKGKVLYCNMEIDGNSFLNRISAVRSALGLVDTGNDIDVLNLRGCVLNMTTLVERIIQTVQPNTYDLVILDPLYMLMEGDENSNSDVGRMFSQIHKLSETLHTAVCFAHHHAKGGSSFKKSIDRGSGAGALGRAPDAILDFLELDTSNAVGLVKTTDATAWQLSAVLREFPSIDDVNVWFKYPCHYIDEGTLKYAKPMDYKTPGEKGNTTKQLNAERTRLIYSDMIMETFNELNQSQSGCKTSDIANALNKDTQWVRRYKPSSLGYANESDKSDGILSII